jgi:eukaryotic-like serine/threonine-protein kinase
MIGSRLSHYAIEALQGQGGMGTVYRARDTLLDRPVAIKILTSSTSTGDTRRRLVREARAACTLNHPNVVTVHAVEQQDDVDFIVMEWLDGGSLAGLIPKEGLPVATAVDYALQIASALAAAHDAGVVHRDVKPGNVIVTTGGSVKVLDFGIARRVPLATEETRQLTVDGTGDGAWTGTPGYLAPEQIAGRPADARSDIFALGVVLFEMLAGRQPFAGDTAWEKLDATVHREATALREVRPEVPRDLAAIVERCLAKRPEDRYSSAGEVRDALRAFQRSQPPVGPRPRVGRIPVVAAVVIIALVGAVAAWSRVRDSRSRWARDTAVTEARRLAAAGDVVGAYRRMEAARAVAPDDPQVLAAWTEFTSPFTIVSTPPGAEVSAATYGTRGDDWLRLGSTPTSARIPVGQLRWRFTKTGYDPIELSPVHPGFGVELMPAGTTPRDMVHVPAGEYDIEPVDRSVKLPGYFIDKYEVTNRAFKEFIDRGGYQKREYWTEPVVRGGSSLPWEEAMRLFVDGTGRPGPATWELGAYPEGQDEWPVSGVSWYEAAAFARYAGKELPTIHHWYAASGAFGVFSEILHFSNFNGRGTVRVGSMGGLGPYGTYDMAGNVKEWCWNDTTKGQRYVLGGSWNGANYQFRDIDAQVPLERRPGNGFRCMMRMKPTAAPPPEAGTDEARWRDPVAPTVRDPATLKPVSDEVYEAYRRLYDYDAIPLDSRVDEVEEAAGWRLERVSYRAVYGNERVPALVFLPREAAPPYQSMIYFPGSDAVMLRSSRAPFLQWVQFIVRSGRAVVYPIYQATYERRTGNVGPNALRQISIQRGQDLRRTVDYVQARPDFDRDKIGFYGLSLGAQLGPVYLAIEPRLKTGVLLSGGFETWTIPAETDPVNFAPRVRQPVLMVNGRDDFDLPYAEAQVPMFQALGTPPADKRHAVLEGGHLPPRPQEVYKEVLDWLDKYLGPVKR